MGLGHVAFTLVVTLALANAASAQPKRFQVLGPNECLNCHDHDAEREWYEKKEIPEVRRLFPDRDAKAGHINSLNQFETPKSDEFAKAIGQADKYDVNGKCVTCHASIFRGDANAGVSCESCHGPGSGYLKPHQTKDTYDVSVAQFGMTKLVGNIQGWTQQCTNCHVMDDERLIKAGHPSGDDFDLSRKYLPVSLHFKKKYAEADVAAIARPQMDAIIRARRGLTTSAATNAASVPAASALATPAGGATATAASAPTPAPAPAPSDNGTPASSPAPAQATTTAVSPANRPSARARAASAPPAPATINLSNPPPGSPTSIEPKVPLDLPAAPAAAPASVATPVQTSPAAPAPAPAPAAPIETSTLLLGGVAIAVIAGGIWWLSRRGRG